MPCHTCGSLPPAVPAGVLGRREEVGLPSGQSALSVADWIFQMYLKNPPSSSGCSCRRQLATDSRQPKRGFGTAVPKTTIEVAERRLSVLCRSIFPANQLKGAQSRSPRREAERAAERCSRARQPINDFSFTQKKAPRFPNGKCGVLPLQRSRRENHIMLRYRSLISSTLMSRGLPGRQASA